MTDIPSDCELPPLGERYVVEACLGEGSMGRVYRARDRQLGRTVAVKVLRSHDPEKVRRFQREARAQASLDHEHVCRVFDVGEVDGLAFLAMQFIDGETLRRAAATLDLDDRVAVMEQVARAVQAAHAGGVVHRDLKPGNVMIERRPDGSPHAWVLDFGLAYEPLGIDGETVAGSSGSVTFLAPEQLRHGSGEADPAVDVYGLGATLYAVLAGQAPFFGSTQAEIRARVLDEEPVPLGLVVPGSSEDLETIVSVAMAKDPARRYPNPRAMADDLARWRRGEPIQARPADPLYRLSTWLRARRVAVVLGALSISVLGVAVGSTLWLRYRELQRRTLIEQHRSEIEQIDRLIRSARMMPLHDTGPAEDEVRRRLGNIEASLLEHGPLARGPAYYALGFGRLTLREFGPATSWLQAAIDAGFARPEVESALGIAQAMELLELRRADVRPADRTPPTEQARLEEIVGHLAAHGPGTVSRDDFQRSLSLFVQGRMDEALEAAEDSARKVPWLYEAWQLQGDILVARSVRSRNQGDADGALADLYRAGEAYASGLAVARSDAWLYEAEAARLLHVIAMERPGADPELVGRAIEMIAAAEAARPRRAGLGVDEFAALRARLQALVTESRGANRG